MLQLIFILALTVGDERPCRMVVNGGEGVQVERDCRIYEDLAMQHLMQATERPGLTFRISKTPECGGASAAVRTKAGVIVACSFREKYGVEIRMTEDRPENWLGLAMEGLDYANRLYLTSAEMQQKCQTVMNEITNPELKKKYHATVDYRETR